MTFAHNQGENPMIKTMSRKRKRDTRYEVSLGEQSVGFHFGKRSLYVFYKGQKGRKRLWQSPLSF